MQIAITPTPISNIPKFETSPHGRKYQVSKASCALNSVCLCIDTIYICVCVVFFFYFSEFSNFLKVNV